MANPYAQAAQIAAPYAGMGTQILAGANAYERGKTHMQSEMAKQFAMQQHGDMYGAQAGKMRAETDTINQRRQYQTPEFAGTAAATSLGINPDVARLIEQGGDHGLPVETAQRYNMLRGSGMLGLNATKDGDSKTTLDTFVKLLGSSATPQQAAVLGQGMAAAEGKPIFHQGTSGTMNNFTGVEAINPEWQKVQRSAAAENYAQANNANVSASLSKSKMVQPTVNPDGSVTAPAMPPKPMPAAALKMQQENLENLSIASNINPMLQRFAEDIDSKKLTLGPVANLVNKGKNFAGSSDEGSRNFASFQATLEKLRNDSLRLNKGVQTDGDAQRAWNELMSNINDPGVVKQRIQEIQGINEKAVELHRMNINQVRRNYGNSDIDVSGYVAKPTSATSKETQPQYSRTGTLNGRKVGMLPNGQTVYQDTGEVAK